MTESIQNEPDRPPCMFRRSWRRGAGRRLGWRQGLQSEEEIALARKREKYHAERSKRKRREAKDTFKIIREYVLLALTVVSTIIIWGLLIENPNAIPIAIGGFGTGGGLAAGFARWRAGKLTGQRRR